MDQSISHGNRGVDTSLRVPSVYHPPSPTLRVCCRNSLTLPSVSGAISSMPIPVPVGTERSDGGGEGDAGGSSIRSSGTGLCVGASLRSDALGTASAAASRLRCNMLYRFFAERDVRFGKCLVTISDQLRPCMATS